MKKIVPGNAYKVINKPKVRQPKKKMTYNAKLLSKMKTRTKRLGG